MFRFFRRLFNVFRRSPKQARETPVAPPLDSSPPSFSPPDSSPPDTDMPQDSDRTNRTDPNSGGSIAAERAAERAAEQQTSMKNLKVVLNVLRAYVVTFGEPGTQLDLRAVIGAIVANVETVEVENSRLERFMDDAIAAYASLGADASLVDVTSQLLAEQVSVWLKTQQRTVSNVLSAYLQQFAPVVSDWESNQILGLVQTIIATLNVG
ncbi:MAG: hypothetical protein AAFY72_12095 [Cyanobacteria bacterium J06649_4]